MKLYDKKQMLYLFSFFMLAGIILMFITQVEYLKKIERIHRENFFLQCKMVLNEVAEEIDLAELIRFHNSNLKAVSEQMMYENAISKETAFQSGWDDFDTLNIEAIFSELRENTDSTEIENDFFARPSKELLRDFYYSRKKLDSYLLKFLYESKKNKLSQLVDPHAILRSIRRKLSMAGINRSFCLQIFDKNNNLLYENYVGGMSRIRATDQNSLVQYIFVGQNEKPTSNPYLRIIFEEPLLEGGWKMGYPSFAISIIMLLATVFAVWIMFRQISFQKRKTDFINNMAHELKTPVASLILSGQMLKGKKIAEQPEKIRRIIEVIDTESQRIKMLVDKVLQLAKFDDGFEIEKKLLDVNDVLLPIVESVALRIENEGGHINLNLDAEDTWILADEVHFPNMFYNLIENAIKYARPNVPLELNISSFNKGVNYPRIVLQIKDNGVGISKENLNYIFERYYRVPTGNQHDVKGFGLGLAYVKSIVRQLNGDIRVKSTLSEGSTFWVELPIAKEA